MNNINLVLLKERDLVTDNRTYGRNHALPPDLKGFYLDGDVIRKFTFPGKTFPGPF